MLRTALFGAVASLATAPVSSPSPPPVAIAAPPRPATVVYDTAPIAGGLRELRADVYAPGPATCRGVVILVHGGSYVGGARDLGENRDYGMALAARGYLALAIGYRLLGDAPVVDGWAARYAAAVAASGDPAIRRQLEAHGNAWPQAAAAAVVDTLGALEWARSHAAGYGCDPDDVALFGASAGAIASLTAAYAADDYADDAVAPVRGVVCLRGMLFPLPDGGSPFRGGDPPLLVLHGIDDDRIPLAAAEDLHALATAAEVPTRLYRAPGYGHDLGGAALLGLSTPDGVTVAAAIDAFLAASFGDRAAIRSGSARLRP